MVTKKCFSVMTSLRWSFAFVPHVVSRPSLDYTVIPKQSDFLIVYLSSSYMVYWERNDFTVEKQFCDKSTLNLPFKTESRYEQLIGYIF